MSRRVLTLIVMAYVITAAAGRAAQNVPRQTTWTFDRLDKSAFFKVPKPAGRVAGRAHRHRR
jgi:hypothetical protein